MNAEDATVRWHADQINKMSSKQAEYYMTRLYGEMNRVYAETGDELIKIAHERIRERLQEIVNCK